MVLLQANLNEGAEAPWGVASEMTDFSIEFCSISSQPASVI